MSVDAKIKCDTCGFSHRYGTIDEDVSEDGARLKLHSLLQWQETDDGRDLCWHCFRVEHGPVRCDVCGRAVDPTELHVKAEDAQLRHVRCDPAVNPDRAKTTRLEVRIRPDVYLMVPPEATDD